MTFDITYLHIKNQRRLGILKFSFECITRYTFKRIKSEYQHIDNLKHQ